MTEPIHGGSRRRRPPRCGHGLIDPTATVSLVTQLSRELATATLRRFIALGQAAPAVATTRVAA